MATKACSSTTDRPSLIPVQGTFSADASNLNLFNIAVAQILPSMGPKAAHEGIKKLEQVAKCASHQGPDVVVVPEYFSLAPHMKLRTL
ncbi:hypothetical protein K437DRAFT_589 [Tilletiaria anomala UBC 951]|uniref:CN hydrolase domain-containing protein n=1 Tax=Tilletiaria anomala (strain ATCC 24038 / CBS 436.72 / UBC 951) TaxID=1037660 RepID=A0A066WHN6_TILAU|nr:uncharacterized protein K437DRAFT_589 [Tilletiaria anomala UBC 951]KDN53517.1 hypothetical protein K437DRAFT_589 [Tilletiaria anomala UBC 951]